MLNNDDRNLLYELTKNTLERTLTNLSKDLASNIITLDISCQKKNNDDLPLLQEQSKQLSRIAKAIDIIIHKYYKLIMKNIEREIKRIDE